MKTPSFCNRIIRPGLLAAALLTAWACRRFCP